MFGERFERAFLAEYMWTSAKRVLSVPPAQAGDTDPFVFALVQFAMLFARLGAETAVSQV
ncbi:MAG: hypothetical protein M3362_13240 [Acidobacteriota bacterium]|nr:hypothetical protein [Acidobacteriota bacterium]